MILKFNLFGQVFQLGLRVFPYAIGLIIVFAPIAFLIFNLRVMRFKYSILGPMEPKDPPNGPPMRHVFSQFAGIGGCERGLGTEFKFYDSGFSIKLFATKVLFVPYIQIKGFKRGLFGLYKIG